MGGKTRTGADGQAAQGWDHDPPPKRKWTPLGILMLATGALTILFGTQETSDFWGDGLKVWWLQVKDGLRSVRRLVIYLDNGPNNSGTRTQFLKRMIEFADWSGLEIRLVYYPPYHSKYNPIERVWGVLEQHWNGSLLDTLETVLNFAQTMTYNGVHPVVDVVTTPYHTGVKLSQKAMAKLEERLERLPGLEKYFVRIAPLSS